jgi:cob(I)alamin adenosyltransferase
MKKSDRGWTDLLFGHRVRKDSPRVEANGALDELNSLLGLAKAMTRPRWIRDLLHECQQDLFVLGAEIACLPKELSRLRRRVDTTHLRRLDEHIASTERKLKRKNRSFLIPGATANSALFDVCRAVARRAERRVVSLRLPPGQLAGAYLNRLSDLLWLLARAQEAKATPTKPERCR